ncbi:MAG: uracil-DNA glycosylase family protein [Bacteroidota bacterium]
MNDKVCEEIDHTGDSTESCRFKQCLRNSDNPTVSICYYKNLGNKLAPIIFRRPDNLERIKFVVISQEPGVSVRTEFDSNIERMKNYWCNLLKSEEKPKKSSPIYLMKEIFQNFDIYQNQVYWTHSLKCIPWETNDQIQQDWIFCAPYCSERLKEELDALPDNDLVIITVGAYALTLVLNIVEGRSLCEPVKLKDYIVRDKIPIIKEIPYGHVSDNKPKKPKCVKIFPFYHPSAYGLPHEYQSIKEKMINTLKAE